MKKITINGIEKAEIRIYGVSGEQIYNQGFEIENKIIDLRDLKPGMYFMKIQTLSGAVIKKLIKE